MPTPHGHTRKDRIRLRPHRGTSLTAAATTGLFTLITAPHLLAAPPAPGAGTKTDKKAPVGAKPAIPVLAGDLTPLSDEQKMLHVLNRMGFGPRPGELAKVKTLGLHEYIEQQLNPQKIKDTAVETKLASLTLINRPSEEIAGLYAMRRDKSVKLLRAKQQRDAEPMADAATMSPNTMTMPTETPVEKRKRGMNALANLTPDERQALMQYQQAQRQVREAGMQLALDKVVRAAESERQFQEVLVDFWSNHFNIDIRKNACAAYKISDERDTIRPNVFGTFRQLLGASAHSPAMLVYLDNAQSQTPRPDTPQEKRRAEMRQRMLDRAAANGNEGAQAAQLAVKNRGKGGINENYAREIMELHTLGVDGGYSQKDVQEVARALTGWTVQRQDGTFHFQANRHDQGEKTVLGQVIPAGGGIEDGEKVLDLLANHPATLRFISTKLCRRLVSDEPPASLVNKCIATWQKTGGDLRSIYRTIVTSPEFFSRSAYHQKVKSPFEYAVSSVRALDARFDLDTLLNDRPRLQMQGAKGKANPNLSRTLAGQVATMGQPLFQYQAPTGYSEDSRKWVSSGALISRLNFALALAGGKLADVSVPKSGDGAVGPSPETVNRLASQLLNGEITPSTRATLLKQSTVAPGAPTVQDTDPTTRLTALVLGSPEFQRK